MIKITADSTCDLSPELIQENGISIMPLNVILGTESFEDGITIEPAKIFYYVAKTGQLPKTAARSIEEYREFFQKFVEKGDTVIHFDISAKASSSYSFAKTASESFPGKVFVIDTYALSSGQGLWIMKACDLRSQGKTAEEICQSVMALKDHVNTSFIPDRLDYLYMGGRCSKMSFYGAKILNLHPMISMKDGQLYAKKKYAGNMMRCLRNYLIDLKNEYPKYDPTRCFITHSNADSELVEFAKNKVKELFQFDEVIETIAGSVVTGHCGRNTIGVLFIYE